MPAGGNLFLSQNKGIYENIFRDNYITHIKTKIKMYCFMFSRTVIAHLSLFTVTQTPKNNTSMGFSKRSK